MHTYTYIWLEDRREDVQYKEGISGKKADHEKLTGVEDGYNA